MRRGGSADSWRKGSGFLKSTGTFFKEKTVGKLALYGFILFYETPNRLKKFATLLPNNWLVETPQPLVARTWQTVGGKGAGF
ncbi:hypothetical protein [Bacillus sp. ISL-34]|uniref:hypothetical protein n=1 Tax=Bacillus sp. ISL-34 TaxID=2819121 RepID=UPI001BE55841|nr:hypothetical protein [Bacillus sp. ISL-34]